MLVWIGKSKHCGKPNPKRMLPKKANEIGYGLSWFYHMSPPVTFQSSSLSRRFFCCSTSQCLDIWFLGWWILIFGLSEIPESFHRHFPPEKQWHFHRFGSVDISLHSTKQLWWDQRTATIWWTPEPQHFFGWNMSKTPDLLENPSPKFTNSLTWSTARYHQKMMAWTNILTRPAALFFGLTPRQAAPQRQGRVRPRAARGEQRGARSCEAPRQGRGVWVEKVQGEERGTAAAGQNHGETNDGDMDMGKQDGFMDFMRNKILWFGYMNGWKCLYEWEKYIYIHTHITVHKH